MKASKRARLLIDLDDLLCSASMLADRLELHWLADVLAGLRRHVARLADRARQRADRR